MKRFTLITVTVLSVATFFGLPWVLGHLNAAKQVAKDHIDQNVPIEMTQAASTARYKKTSRPCSITRYSSLKPRTATEC